MFGWFWSVAVKSSVPALIKPRNGFELNVTLAALSDCDNINSRQVLKVETFNHGGFLYFYIFYFLNIRQPKYNLINKIDRYK
jgi:hypothetical protein